jgi:hypothetical protein
MKTPMYMYSTLLKSPPQPIPRQQQQITQDINVINSALHKEALS